MLCFREELQVLMSYACASVFAAIEDDHVTISHLPQGLHCGFQVICIQSFCLRLIFNGV